MSIIFIFKIYTSSFVSWYLTFHQSQYFARQVFFLFSPGLGRLSQAEEYLAQAQWTVLKTPECTDSIKSKLFRNLGLLYAAQGNYPDSLSQLADDVST